MALSLSTRGREKKFQNQINQCSIAQLGSDIAIFIVIVISSNQFLLNNKANCNSRVQNEASLI
jgi:hypothetical protein